MKHTFHRGGIHPPGEKHLTRDKPIETLAPPGEVWIPLNQNLGAPSRPVVARGDHVKTGQVIAEPTGFVSSPVHASISGTVRSISMRRTSVSPHSPCIEIQSDGEDTWVDSFDPGGRAVDYSDASRLLDVIRDAGLVGMGGAAFPTHVKLSPPAECEVDALILNGVECEPYLNADNRLMIEHADEILQGLRIMKSVLGVEQVVVGIEDNKPQAIQVMRETTAGVQGVRIEVLKTCYPQGAEKQLIKALLGREVPPGKLPMHVGVVVQNVGTAYAAFEAVAQCKPLIERVLTVSGPAIRQPRNLRVRLGTPLPVVIAHCGGVTDDLAKVVMGGPMMGRALRTTDVPILKSTSGLVFLDKGRARFMSVAPCIRCGRCVQACPQGLMPGAMARQVEAGQFERLADAMDCLECGSCQYACPSRRRLVHLVRLGKNEYRKHLEQAQQKKSA